MFKSQEKQENCNIKCHRQTTLAEMNDELGAVRTNKRNFSKKSNALFHGQNL